MKKKVEERPKSNVCRSSKKWRVNDEDNREYEFSKYKNKKEYNLG